MGLTRDDFQASRVHLTLSPLVRVGLRTGAGDGGGPVTCPQIGGERKKSRIFPFFRSPVGLTGFEPVTLQFLHISWLAKEMDTAMLYR